MAKTNTPLPKQKNLFSFFSKKSPSPPRAASSSPPSSSHASGKAKAAAASSAAANAGANDNSQKRKSSSSSASAGEKLSAQQMKLLSRLAIGTKLAVYWPDDSEFYPCEIHAHRPRRGHDAGHVYTLNYEDGEVETVDLAGERFRILGGRKRVPDRGGADDGANKKRRRIVEESEEDEMESSEEEGDDDGSEYKTAGGDNDSVDDESLVAEEGAKGVSEEDDWLDSDKEEEEEAPKKKRAAKRAVEKVTVTTVGSGATRHVSPTPAKPSKGVAKGKSVAAAMDFSSFAVSSEKAARPAAPRAPRVSLSPAPGAKSPRPAAPSTKRAAIPKPDKDAVNPAGTHLHNHLGFFVAGRRDHERRPPDHPDHTPSTLHVNQEELARASGGKVSPAQKQWWNIKSQYADTVLLFKTGKFYEMYHDDADVGVAVLGHVYMRGAMAHSGFPEAGYARVLSKLVDAGHTVARVEQTETPAMMSARKKVMRRGEAKPQVVCREVCGIVSKGTRTFCYLEDTKMLESGKAGTGPLVAIKEVLVEGSEGVDEGHEETGSTKAMYEYGVTVVDAVTGVVTLGQFADDVLRSRMRTLLASFGPSEVLYEGGRDGASKTLPPFLRSACPPDAIVRPVLPRERFPRSTAVCPDVRRALDRGDDRDVRPWDGDETVREVHLRGYFPRSSRARRDDGDPAGGVGRWPEVLRRCVEGGAALAVSSFGAALFCLQKSLVDTEILGMGTVKAYAPPNTSMEAAGGDDASDPSRRLEDMYDEEARRNEGLDLVEPRQDGERGRTNGIDFGAPAVDDDPAYAAEASIDHMALDGTTLSNLEILHNITSGSYHGSLLSKIDATQSPHGSRLLRAWLLRPLFRKEDIDRRADVVEELAGGSAAVAMEEARALLKKTGDIERLLSRVHSMGGGRRAQSGEGDDGARAAAHPDERAVLYETDKHTRRKVGDFSKLLHGLRAAAEIPDVFASVPDVRSPMLAKIVRTANAGGCFPSDMGERLDWFFDNFDLGAAAEGRFEPARGMDERYDEACDAIGEVERQLAAYREEMCSNGELMPRHTARSAWKYINTKEESKDKYLIELPVSVGVPDDFCIKAKRGKGAKQVNKYRTPVVEELVERLERAIDVKKEGKAAGMKLVFARFDSLRSVWMAATHATAMLDALGSLAQIAVRPGFSRPEIVNCPPSAKPGVEIVQGRHPCVDSTHSGGDFIPNDLILGAVDGEARRDASVLLLSGPNMGGKSTLLRQTCLISILAQIGSYVPAERCALTPVDRIFTRLGASDRILCGQSTFFVELAETAAAVRGATRRSLVIMDELGRGTSTFDGTAIASATVKHLVERNGCLTLFATHYHSLLEDWKNEPSIKLGHMECIVEDDDDEEHPKRKNNITFLYTLGDGPCPKSFGVNVARLAGLPDDVLERAKRVSSLFEAEMNGEANSHQLKSTPSKAERSVDTISELFLEDAVDGNNKVKQIWESLQK